MNDKKNNNYNFAFIVKRSSLTITEIIVALATGFYNQPGGDLLKNHVIN